MQLHRFTVDVNCSLENYGLHSKKSKDLNKHYADNGFIMLPDEYTDHKEPTRLVINCHGAGGSIDTDDSQVEHQVWAQYLVANGYAVMDVNGLPELYAKENDIDIRNNLGSPFAVSSLVKAYHYCMEHFNLKPDVFVHGGSMGGISSTNLVLNGGLPVIAHSAFCPVLDTYNQIFLHPWTNGLPKIAMGKIYEFETDQNGEYIYDESKLQGYNPVNNPKAVSYPVPLKFWHCEDDDVVAYDVTKKFIKKLQENGNEAYLKTLLLGKHEPQFAGGITNSPKGNNVYNGKKLEITNTIEEAFEWIKRFDF